MKVVNREAMQEAFAAKYEEIGEDVWQDSGNDKIFEFGWQAALAQANVNEQSQAVELSSIPLQLPTMSQFANKADYEAAMKSQAQQSQWISVEELLPKAHATVLVVTNFDCIYTCRLPVIVAKNSALDLENGIRERFTHWMPLPLPPAPEGDSK